MKKYTENLDVSYEEALKRIELCKSSGIKTLDLSALGIKSIPPEIASLSKITTLDLSGNSLISLPDFIGNLSSLCRLDVSSNMLIDLPQALFRLKKLKSFSAQNNQLKSIPPEISALRSLNLLELGDNNISELPIEFGSLANLEEVNLTENELLELPKEIAGLKKLKFLFLGYNKLTNLPSEIGGLISLEQIFFHKNHVAEIPSEIGKLKNIRLIEGSGNQITHLPKELFQLNSVQTIALANNKIGTLPQNCEGCSELTQLVLSDNQLKAIPQWISQVPKLSILLLHKNPALKLSTTVLGPNPLTSSGVAVSAKSILDFYFSRQRGKTRPLNEVKLIMVGRGGAGKTSTVRALRGLPFNNNEVSTPGIALSDWIMEGCKKDPVIAHIWDFAGQVITHALHQFFFSVRSVYVVVLSGRENNEREDAEYWLRLIRAFGTDEQGNGPPVVIALNKWDLPGSQPSIDRSALQERYPFIQKFVEIDCKTNKGIERLRTSLCREVDRLKWVREPFPESWDKVRRALSMGRRKRAHLSYMDYRALCSEKGVFDEGEQDSLAEVLHHLGAALNYRTDPRLREATVLQPEWLTKNVYGLVRRAEKLSGALTQSDVDSVLRSEKDPAMRSYLIQIMERFEIAYAPLARDEAGGTWLIPQALRDQQPRAVAAFRDLQSSTRLRYTYPALPEGLVARAIVRLHEFIEEIDGERQQWASGVILRRDDARALIRTIAQDRQVVITVTGPAKARQKLAGLCQAEMRDIHAEIRGLEAIEETEVRNSWIATKTLELDEKNRKQTGIATKDQGTVMVDPAISNNEYSEKLARLDDVWRPTIFISYSKSNVNQRKRLESELKILKNEGLLAASWHDRMIEPGAEWDGIIQEELRKADVVIVLTSSAALATDYITRHEIPKAIELHNSRETVVIPVILEACRWNMTALGALSALPEKGKAINKWKPQSDAWNSVADGLAIVFDKLMRNGIGKRRKNINSLQISLNLNKAT